ncbi:MAG: TlpA disulfide reductase family protein [Motiliproteus sp.]
MLSFIAIKRTLGLLGILLALPGCDAEPPAPGLGVSLARVSLPELDGSSVSLAQFRDKVLVLNFWATWCSPCREEMPALQALSEQLDPERYRVIGVNVDQDLNLVREFVLKYGISFLQLTDVSMAVSSDLLAIGFFPQTLIVDPQGVVKVSISGSRAWDDPVYYQPLLEAAGGR